MSELDRMLEAGVEPTYEFVRTYEATSAPAFLSWGAEALIFGGRLANMVMDGTPSKTCLNVQTINEPSFGDSASLCLHNMWMVCHDPESKAEDEKLEMLALRLENALTLMDEDVA